MNVILYMATSVNGYIAQINHETPWSGEEFASYTAKVKKYGNILVGKTTYDLMLEEDAFAALGEPFVVVLTTSKSKPQRKKTLFVHSFDEALTLLETKGFTTAIVAGGGKLDAEALQSGLIQEFFIDIEPWIFGQGIPLFSPNLTNVKLKLFETKRIGASGVQLHYQRVD